MFIAVCPKCFKKVGVPRPGSVPDMDQIVTDCPFCPNGKIKSADVYDVVEPKAEAPSFDLLGVN
ncbi:MAG TPA: hypothetical protein ENH94_03435 [Phycisphaerales bacterium]|nr:hypothetical protein [Phycisphaerales bacterium]